MTRPVENLIAVWLAGQGYNWADVDKALDLMDYLKTQGYEITETVPEVEVTHSTSLQSVEAQETPVAARRSAAKNVSPPRLQMAFMDEARLSMGQPGQDEAMQALGKRIRITFNVDKSPVEGVLTQVINHPANSPTYLLLEDSSILYPLASIQSIELVGE